MKTLHENYMKKSMDLGDFEQNSQIIIRISYTTIKFD